MKFGVQRRGIYLAPLRGLDRMWIFSQLEAPEIRDNLGVEEGDQLGLRMEHSLGKIVLGTIRRVVNRQRIGFVAMRHPAGDQDFWDFSYAIPDARHRDAFSAMHSIDAIVHYMLDHLGVPAVGGLTREDNLPAQVVARRIGYRIIDTRDYGDGIRWSVFRFGREEWARRVARLERGEASHPSGLGRVFHVLPEAPFDPVVTPELLAEHGGDG
ncbi:MAG: hypothetical protein HY904_14390 [Deltaproteobacteria bacterium]|nr:hypothetical protein [Deltaproteobacteria bacterium]